MTKENKIIKDLKERNGKLVNQYRDRDIRCISLERQLDKLKEENLELRIQVSAREEVANKYKAVIDKAKEVINKCVELQLENDYLMDRINLANYNMKLLDILKEVE